jgi:hypothetical protein
LGRGFMDFKVTELAELPRLAWLASVDQVSLAAQVVCGSSVEHGAPRAFLSDAAYGSFRGFLHEHHIMEAVPIRRHRALAQFCRTRLLTSYTVARLLELTGLDSFEYFKWRYSKDIERRRSCSTGRSPDNVDRTAGPLRNGFPRVTPDNLKTVR